jgi:hypothetical protein
VINHKKKKKARERGHQPEEDAAELRSKFICPKRNFEVKGKGINTPPSTVYLR